MSAYDTTAGRADLEAFDAHQPTNFWEADAHLRRVVAAWAGQETLEAWEAELSEFGAISATEIDPLVRLNDRVGNHPRLERWGPFGERLEAVEHHPSYHAAGRAIYGSGVIAALGEDGGVLRSQTLGYLSGLNGEAGHNCPAACTAGLVKALRAVGSEELKARYLPRLLSTDYDELAHGAQFLTEVQGGSDVGANEVVARPGARGEPWELTGEKWFCSNVTADLILLTARPEGAPAGTRGLSLFLAPRRLPDGSLNHFAIRRLKDKLGTRSMASAELDLLGLRAWPLGPLEDGFKNMMTHVINTSRLWNAVGTAAIARRSHWVARGYAEHRRAFGAAIGRYPMVQETLADMRVEADAMVSGTFYLLHLADRLERGEGDAALADFHRMAVNLNKMRGAQSGHEVVLSGVEVLGGNGAIESFSVLPRLLRDNVVYENWEGTHNVLLNQVLRDCRRLEVHEGFLSHLRQLASGHGRILAALEAAEAHLRQTLEAPDALATLEMRRAGERLSFLLWAAAMAADGTDGAVLEHFLDRRLGPAAPLDEAYLARIARLSGLREVAT
ncbi:MAG: acyl-CoA dehydrogenase family protein [Deltaproteobacteria bacterium]|nr:acyl-CoA dehydrogenase family protein [Deltaproteobacteria bacterium]